MQTRGLKSELWNVDATKSSQVLSALLMIAPTINRKTTIQYSGGTVSEPFVDLTLKMIQMFSTHEKCSAEKKDSEISISSEGYRAKDFTYEIEPDATAASYFLTLPIVTNGNCRVLGISKIMDQGDAAYVEVLEEIGFRMVEDNTGITSTFVGAVEKVKFDFNAISDTFLTLAAITPILPKRVKIYGIAHTRKQETDRVKAMAIELRKLGQKVIESEDSLEIYPNLESLKQNVSSGISIDTYHDHRFAMSFGILGCFDLFSNGQPWLTINNPLCCAKTFPDFFERLKIARLESHG
jgi:3-phosphoshikimate 1-carboxyvinyltransferase